MTIAILKPASAQGYLGQWYGTSNGTDGLYALFTPDTLTFWFYNSDSLCYDVSQLSYAPGEPTFTLTMMDDGEEGSESFTFEVGVTYSDAALTLTFEDDELGMELVYNMAPSAEVLEDLLDCLDSDDVGGGDDAGGCQDQTACNYGAAEVACVYADGNCEVCDGNGDVAVQDADGDGICDGDEAPCAGDLDSDGNVTVNDMLMLLSDFGCMANCQADINGDAVVGVADVLALLSAFGQLCE